MYAPASALEGDFNGDAHIDMADAIVALKAITGSPPPSPGKFTNSVGMSFVTIAAGTFLMGSASTERDRHPDESVRTVTISAPFYIQTTEVTQGQWMAVMGTRPSRFDDCGYSCPVESVSWYDAQAFIEALNTRENTSAYRLPTEAEWEYAARAGTTTATSAGDLTVSECTVDPNLSPAAWYCGNAGDRSHPAGGKTPNPLGLYDIHGNVWEWTTDGYLTNLPPGPITNPAVGETPDGYVVRGGGWSGDARTCRSADRDAATATARAADLGFRVLRTR